VGPGVRRTPRWNAELCGRKILPFTQAQRARVIGSTLFRAGGLSLRLAGARLGKRDALRRGDQVRGRLRVGSPSGDQPRRPTPASIARAPALQQVALPRHQRIRRPRSRRTVALARCARSIPRSTLSFRRSRALNVPDHPSRLLNARSAAWRVTSTNAGHAPTTRALDEQRHQAAEPGRRPRQSAAACSCTVRHRPRDWYGATQAPPQSL